MKTLVVIVLLGLLSGCTHVSYNPKTKKVDYTRMGSFKAKDILIELGKKGNVWVQVGSTESDASEFILKILEMGIALGRATVAIP